MVDILPAAEIYLITPEEIELDQFASSLKGVMNEVPVSCLQIRLPHADKNILKAAIEKLAPIAWEHEAAVLLCDQPDLAVEMDLDGVHLETSVDAKHVKAIRKIVGNDRSIGVSCLNSTHTAMLAGEAGADYVSFGPLFPSPTKGMPAEEGVDECLRAWALAMEVPCVAIGGITTDNVNIALATGAEFIAPLSGIWQHPEGPVAAAKIFYEATQTYQNS
ncbi:thiamine phosphate synthase [Curvivirga sp.]|uniref:thiamine phosphate synthase n=1 Tax=Curvivirga sp. TaxID=2856848 RepID=UPI003B59A68C